MKYQELINNYIDSHVDELVDATGRLVAVPSTKGPAEDGAPFGRGPLNALNAALKIAKEWGLDGASYDNYVGTVDINTYDTNLHILCHLDVVDPGTGWDTDPYQMVEKDGLIYGRGVDDDKGPAMISMMALRAVKELGIPLKHNVRLILGTDEESGSGDISYYYAKEPYVDYTFSPDADFPVINLEKGHFGGQFKGMWDLETVLPRVTSINGGIRFNVVPPESNAFVAGIHVEELKPYAVQTEAKTGVCIELVEDPDGTQILVHGKNAHAASPDDGNNAITAMLQLLNALPLADCASTKAIHDLAKLFPHGDNAGEALGIANSDEMSGALTLAFSMFTMNENGFAGSYDSRTPVSSNEDNCVNIAKDAFVSRGYQFEGGIHAAHYIPADSLFVKTLLECYETYSGRKGYCQAIGGGTYVHDIPGGVAFGAGNLDFASNLHAANERACIKSMLMAAKIYAQAIVELCGDND